MGAKSETGKKFTKVYQKTIFSQIAKQILNAIQNGEYKPGDKLPSERSIAEQMGVSRNAVREALKSLQILGVIRSKTGDGTYVAKVDLDRDNVFAILDKSYSPLEIIEARKAFEMGFIDKAIASLQESDVRALRRSLEKMREQAIAENYEAYLAAGREFHISLAKACHNEVIEEVSRFLWDITNSRLSAVFHKAYCAKSLANSIKIHSLLFQAVAARDLKVAKKMINRHYKELKDFFKV